MLDCGWLDGVRGDEVNRAPALVRRARWLAPPPSWLAWRRLARRWLRPLARGRGRVRTRWRGRRGMARRGGRPPARRLGAAVLVPARRRARARDARARAPDGGRGDRVSRRDEEERERRGRQDAPRA